MKQLKSFLISNSRFCDVWSWPLHIVGIHAELRETNFLFLDVIHRGLKVKGFYKRLIVCSFLPIEFFCNFPLNEYCQTFIEPKVLPSPTSHEITSPWVSDFVNGCRYLGFVTCYHSGWYESQQRIFHTSKWESWWQHKHVILSPCIRDPDIFLNLIEIILQAVQLLRRTFNLCRFSNKPNSVSKRHPLQISNSQGDEIGRNRNRVFKFVLTMGGVQLDQWSVVGTHFDCELLRNSDSCAVSSFHCRCILHRR